MARTKIDLNAQALAASLSSDILGTGSVIEAKIGTGAVTETKIGALAVTEGKIGAAAVTEAKIGSAAVTATKIGALAISDSHINAAAAIAYSKLNLATSIVNGDIAPAAAIVYSKLSIADADLTIAKTSGLQGALDAKLALAGGTMTGDIAMGGFKVTGLANGTLSQDAVTKAQLDAVQSSVSTFEWQESAKDYVVNNTLAPATEVTGDRYILSADGGAPHIDWDGASAGDIVEFNGTVWVAVTPSIGTFISADDEPNKLYLWGGAAWDAKNFEQTTASTGLVKSGFDIQMASTAGGAGLTFTAGVLAVGAGAAIDVAADAVAVKYDAATIKLNGSNQLYVDQTALTAVNAATVDSIEGASLLRSDTSDNFTSGTLTFDTGTSLVAAAGSTFNVAGTFQIGGVSTSVTALELNNLGTFLRETPAEVPNGVISQFSLTQTPITGSLMVFLNGVLQEPIDDYTLAGTTVTFLTPLPQTGDKVRFIYRY